MEQDFLGFETLIALLYLSSWRDAASLFRRQWETCKTNFFSKLQFTWTESWSRAECKHNLNQGFCDQFIRLKTVKVRSSCCIFREARDRWRYLTLSTVSTSRLSESRGSVVKSCLAQTILTLVLSIWSPNCYYCTTPEEHVFEPNKGR